MTVSQSEMAFWRRLFVLLDRVAKSYDGYRTTGQSRLYAELLRRDNDLLRRLIFDSAPVIPVELDAAFLELTHHLDVWCALWDYHARQHEIALNEPFVFQNAVTFPREALGKIESWAARHLPEVRP